MGRYLVKASKRGKTIDYVKIPNGWSKKKISKQKRKLFKGYKTVTAKNYLKAIEKVSGIKLKRRG